MTAERTALSTTAALRAGLGPGFTGATTGPGEPDYDAARACGTRPWTGTPC